MKTLIKCITAATILIAFSSCQTTPSGNDNIIPPAHKSTQIPMVVC